VNAKVQLHAVVRHDSYAKNIEDAITIVAVVPTREEAMSEVDRLNGIREREGGPSRYFWLPANYFPEGRGVQRG
jgi:hypothetical protein